MSRFAVAKLARKLHMHACPTCGLPRWCSCATPAVDLPPCTECTTGRRSTLVDGWRPIPCCESATQPATNDERTLYRLAGPGPWWLCRRCARVFGFQPSLGDE